MSSRKRLLLRILPGLVPLRSAKFVQVSDDIDPEASCWAIVRKRTSTISSTEASLRRVKEISKAMSAPSLSGQKPDAAGKAFPR
jgi:hypothetical protein